MPVLLFRGAPLGSSASSTLHDKPGRWFAVFLALAGTRYGTGIGELWLDPLSAVLIGFGRLDATGQRRIGTGVRNDSALFGAAIAVQAVLADPLPIELSNAATGVLH